MDRVFRSDTSRLAKFPRTGAGAVRVPATIARTGVLLYPGKGPGGSTLREYRSPDEVFSADSLASLGGVPVTVGHPNAPGGVTPANARGVQVGHTSDLPPDVRVKVDGDPHEWLRTNLVIADGQTLDEIDRTDDSIEVSCGYTCVLDHTPGIAPNGEHYDARQTAVRFNHVAIKVKARAGANARLRLDHQEPMKIVVIDGVEFEFGSDKHVTKIQTDAASVLATETARADKAEARADAAEEKATKAEAQLNADALDARVEARFNLLKSAARFLPATYDTKGKSDSQVRLDALTAAKVDVTGKSEAYIEARFDGLVDAAGKDTKQFGKAPDGTPLAAPAPAPRADAINSDDAFRAELAKKDSK